MFSNRIMVVAVAAACVASAGAGSYFAARQNVAELASPTAAASSAPASAAAPAALVEPIEATPSPALRVTAQPPAPAPSVASGNDTRPRVRATAPRAEAPVARTNKPERAAEPTPSNAPRTVPAPIAAVEPAVEAAAKSARTEERLPVESALAPEQATRNFEELTVAADSVIGLETDAVLSSATARIEDRVEARVVRDVRVGGQVAIPAGTRAVGSVVVVDRGGRFKDRARLGIRFQTLVMADGSQLPIDTETIYRFGNAPGNASAQRIGGGAVIGAIIGGIVGGGKGAAIGATAGAGAGTASVITSDRTEAVIPAGAEVTARILNPIVVTIEKD